MAIKSSIIIHLRETKLLRQHVASYNCNSRHLCILIDNLQQNTQKREITNKA